MSEPMTAEERARKIAAECFGLGQNLVDQIIAEIRRVEIQQPDPVDLLGQLAHQGNDRPLPHSLVAAERGQILGHQHDLTHIQLIHLGDDLGDRAAPLGAAK